MKSIYSLCIALILSVPLALAQQHDNHQSHSAAQGGQNSMMKLHGHFQQMRDIMAKVKTEKDSQKHDELMLQHLQLMRESMNILRGMQNSMMKQDKMDMGAMNHHLSMMEDMLRQMEAYSTALQE